MSGQSERAPDAMELHEIGRLVLSAGIGPRFDLAAVRNGKVEVIADRTTRETVEIDLWSDLGPSTGGARAVAEAFIDDLERRGFTIVRSPRW